MKIFLKTKQSILKEKTKMIFKTVLYIDGRVYIILDLKLDPTINKIELKVIRPTSIFGYLGKIIQKKPDEVWHIDRESLIPLDQLGMDLSYIVMEDRGVKSCFYDFFGDATTLIALDKIKSELEGCKTTIASLSRELQEGKGQAMVRAAEENAVLKKITGSGSPAYQEDDRRFHIPRIGRSSIEEDI